jgi:hypothetical protein
VKVGAARQSCHKFPITGAAGFDYDLRFKTRNMNVGKANVRMTEWDKEKTCRLGSRYQFWLKLSERPDAIGF